MKQNLLFFLLVWCFSSCGSPDYEKAVADWVQTDKNGMRTNLKFEILEVSGITDITVADSLAVLKERFEIQKEKEISILAKELESAKTKMSFAKYAGVDLESYQNNINEAQVKLDSIKKQAFHSIYDKRKNEEVIAKILECRYAITPPLMKVKQEKRAAFILSPDMKKCFKIILSIFVLVLTFVAGFQTANLRNEGKWKLEQKNNQSGIDLKLPGENEKSIVTVEEVEAKLKGIAELSSYSGEYTVTYGKDTARYWLDNIKIFGTTNSIEIKASGVVKVGYDMSKMVINVDNDSSKIYIKLPEIQLNDNYVIWDTVTSVSYTHLTLPTN